MLVAYADTFAIVLFILVIVGPTKPEALTVPLTCTPYGKSASCPSASVSIENAPVLVRRISLL